METHFQVPIEDDLGHASPYGDRPLTVAEHLTIAAYWFATNFHWGALLLILLPNDIRILAPDNKATVLGLVTGLGAIPALIVPLIAGALSDRCTHPSGRRKPFLAKGIAINVIGLMMMAATVQMHDSLPAPLAFYLLGYTVVQIGNNIASGAFMGVIPDVVPDKERGKASGYMALMTQFGTLLGAVGAGMILKGTIERYLAVAIVLVLVGFSTKKIKEFHQTESEPINWKTYWKSIWIDPKQFPDFAWVWITRFLVMMGFYAIMPFINYYLVDVVGVPQNKVDSTAPMLLGVVLIVSSISGYYGGTISDRIGRKKVVYIANTLIAIVAPLFILAHSMPIALVVGALFGFGYGAYISVDYALGTDVLPSNTDSGKDMAVWHIAMTLPQSLTAPIAGVLISLPGKTTSPAIEVGGDAITHYNIAGYAMVFFLCSICFALGAYLLRNVKGVK
jgi:MFS family permease